MSVYGENNFLCTEIAEGIVINVSYVIRLIMYRRLDVREEIGAKI